MISVASGPLPVLPDLDPGVAGHSAVPIPCSIQRKRQSREHHKIGVELPTPPNPRTRSRRNTGWRLGGHRLKTIIGSADYLGQQGPGAIRMPQSFPGEARRFHKSLSHRQKGGFSTRPTALFSPNPARAFDRL